MGIVDPQVQVDLSIQNRAEQEASALSPLVFYLSALADDTPTWPTPQRDVYLDRIWREEPIVAGAVYSMCAKIAALDYKLTGPRKAVNRWNTILQSADLGNGWIHFVFALAQDLFTQDNGAFIELLRQPGSGKHTAAQGVAQLDSQRCVRTGDPVQPVDYYDVRDNVHKLQWYDVIPMVDMPSSREKHVGIGFCAISRILRAAQTLKALSVYKRQKLSGKRVPGILFVQGIRRGAVEEAITRSMEAEIEHRGRTLYTGPVILAGPDPGVPLDAKLIELAGLPDGFNEDILLKWYIATLALGFGTDYSEFAPLPGGNLGSASQVETMAAKARGKGPGVIIQQFEFGFNHFVLPQSLEFQFTSTDPAAERERVELSHARARERALRVTSQEITPQQALELAVTEGDAPESFLAQATIADPRDEEEERVTHIVRSLQEMRSAMQVVMQRYHLG
ncbi:hypothetical protein LCGC14_0275410 [marine sediment metagenome]|uniref:Portal protein n=1 Tax=marine sediment metagenome TaxID=412755 RepID=A0A0F9WIE8_9ZZZZ